MDNQNYLQANKALWDAWASKHVASDFYDVPSFVKGRNSLTDIDLGMLGDIAGKRILHLQCHFGQDTLSMGRMGATCTGVDLSTTAIEAAKNLAMEVGVDARFIACDLYSLPQHLDETFDIVFTSFGTIGWLPDINRWAEVVRRYTREGGVFVFAEFHPVVWMFDNDFQRINYSYFHGDVIEEQEEGSYAADSDESLRSVTWNHGLAEVVTALLKQGFRIDHFEEFDYSPHNCFQHTEAFEPGKYRIKHLGNKLPMVYALKARG